MKIAYLLLPAAFATGVTFCQGQTFANENGLEFKYDGSKKTGSRYDEYCKTTFDIYTVQGTVVNKNGDKAAAVRAVLIFNGHTCNKIYGEAGPKGGEVIHKDYTLDVGLQTKHPESYWVNRFLKLLPNDEITAFGNVEVKQGEPCPEPSFTFSYELVPGKSSAAPAKPEDEVTEKSQQRSADVRDDRSKVNDADTSTVKADEAAQFPGGINAFRTQVGRNLDVGNIVGLGKIQTMLLFIIDKDGSIGDVEATGANESFNKEAERALRAVKTLWTPAKLDGRPVRCKLKLPLSMILTKE